MGSAGLYQLVLTGFDIAQPIFTLDIGDLADLPMSNLVFQAIRSRTSGTD